MNKRTPVIIFQIIFCTHVVLAGSAIAQPVKSDEHVKQAYLEQVDRMVEKALRKPKEYESCGATVSFKIDDQGNPVGAKIVGFSGVTVFDNAVLAAVAKSSHFPRPPVKLIEAELTYNVDCAPIWLSCNLG